MGVLRPSAQVAGPVALHQVDDDAGLQVDQAGGVDGRMGGLGRQLGGLILHASWRTAPTRFGSSTRGVPCSIAAFMTVHQHTPNSAATTETARASSPTCRHVSAPARRVRTTWASMWREPSVQVLASQSGSTQRQRRLIHRSRAGRPKQGRSRMSMGMRSWASARVPQLRQPTTPTVVSMVITSSSGPSTHLEDPEPVQSQKRLRQPGTVGHLRDLPSSQPWTATTIAGSLPALVDPRLLHAPREGGGMSVGRDVTGRCSRDAVLVRLATARPRHRRVGGRRYA